MITAEQNEKKMKLTWPQIKRLMGKQIESRIYTNNQTGDIVTAKQWKNFMVKMEAKDMSQRINEEFIQDFIKWLTGRSVYNSSKYFEIVQDEFGKPLSKEVTMGCPWGNKPLTHLPGVSEFLDQGIDRRSKVIDYIAKLKMHGPRNLDEAYMYYKYILRKVAVDDDTCFEMQELADFDYPVDPKTGETVGPASTDLPPLFDEAKYAANFMMVYAMTVQAPGLTAEWILNGAKAADLRKLALGDGIRLIDKTKIKKFLETNDYDLIYDTASGKYKYIGQYIREGSDALEREARRQRARQEVRERERRRKLRKAGRAPSAKMATTGATAKAATGVDIDLLVGPEGRQKARRLNRRENRRDNRLDDEREDLAIALGMENFGTEKYVSFWALSSSDQDYIMASLLAQNAFASAGQALQSPASTGVAGGPVSFQQGRTNQAQYAYPGQETQDVEDNDKTRAEKLTQLSQNIRSLPGSVSDAATQNILRKIHKTLKRIENKDMAPKVSVTNDQPINIDTGNWIGIVKENTKMMDALKGVLGELDVKIRDFGRGPGGTGGVAPSPPFQIPPGYEKSMGEIDEKLKTVIGVLKGGIPVTFAQQLHPPSPPPVGVPVQPDQVMSDRDINLDTATIHVKKQTVSNTYGDLVIDHKTAESIGKGMGASMPQPKVNYTHTGDIKPNITYEHTGDIYPELKIDKDTPLIVDVGGTKIDARVDKVDVNLPPELGAEIAKNFDYEKMGQAIGKNIKIPGQEPQPKAPRAPKPKTSAPPVVDITALSNKLDESFKTIAESKTELMNIQAAHSKEIGALYKEMKELRLQQTTELDNMKKILDTLTPLQTAVAGLVANSGVDLDGDVDIKEKSLNEKLQQVVKLDQDTIDKLITGSTEGIDGLKGEITKLVNAVNEGLFSEHTSEKWGVTRKIGLVAIADKLLEHSVHQSRILQDSLEYVPPDMREHVSNNVLTMLMDKVNDPSSIFNKAEVTVANITDKNFVRMSTEMTNIEKQLVDQKAALKLQKEVLDLKKDELDRKFKDAVALAEQKTAEEKEKISSAMLELRNQYSLTQAEFAQKVNEYTVLAHSHKNLQTAFEDFKKKNADSKKALKDTLTDVIGTELKPLFAEATQQIVDAVELNIGPGADVDEDEQAPLKNESEDASAGLSKSEKEEAAIVGEAQKEVYEFLQQQQEIEPTVDIGPAKVYIDHTALETKRTLEQLIKDEIANDPRASVYNILKNPIQQVLDVLRPETSGYRDIEPSKLTLEQRFKRNQLFAAEAYETNLENKFRSLPEQIGKQFLNPVANLQSEEERIQAVTKGLTLLSREKNSLKESKSSFKQFSELLTNYKKAVSGMQEDPTTGGASVLARDNIGKWTGNRLRNNTGYRVNDQVSALVSSTPEMDSYLTLARVGRDMDNAYKAGDNLAFQTLAKAVANYDSFNDVLFTKNSPLYQAMVAGDHQGIVNSLSQDGTAHLDRTWYTTSMKARTDLLYRAFANKIVDDAYDEAAPATETEQAVAEHTAHKIYDREMQENRLVTHKDFKDSVNNISLEETSVYLQAFMRAAIATNMTKIGFTNIPDASTDFVRSIGKMSNGNLYEDIKVMGEVFNQAATHSSKMLMDHPQNELVKKVFDDRQQTIKDLSEKMFAAMMLNVLPEFKNLSLPSAETLAAHSPEELTVASEAVDTLVGLADGNIAADLSKRADRMEAPVSQLQQAKLIASQVKNAVEAIDKEGKKVLSDMRTKATSDVSGILQQFMNAAYKELETQMPNIYHAVPMAMVA